MSLEKLSERDVGAGGLPVEARVGLTGRTLGHLTLAATVLFGLLLVPPVQVTGQSPPAYGDVGGSGHLPAGPLPGNPDAGRFPGYQVPRYESSWFQRPYPYHLDYYRMRYGGSYAPYFGNLYGPPAYYYGVPPFGGGFGGAYYW
ncbi:MAG: hypothetical protein ACC645_22135 [Pirellulales bacterium]